MGSWFEGDSARRGWRAGCECKAAGHVVPSGRTRRERAAAVFLAVGDLFR